MLQLNTHTFDLCQIGKILAEYKIKASIANQVITLEDDISDELLDKLVNIVNISSVQNFPNQLLLEVPKTLPSIKNTSNKEPFVENKINNIPVVQKTKPLTQNTNTYEVLYPRVKRGEVYMCDLGKPYGSEESFARYVIIIQNDLGNLYSPTTIVIFCTTAHKKRLLVNFHCKFSTANMIDYDPLRVGSEENIIMTNQLHTIDKSRLRKYIGTLTPNFMKIIDRRLYACLSLAREHAEIIESPKQKDLNLIQVQLLNFVEISKLLSISKINCSNEEKVEKILELFGFDLKRNGVNYLYKAILDCTKATYFNVETLCEKISEEVHVDKEEVKRLIVARVKEQFGFKKSPASDFIKLVNQFLQKQEENNYEENNI